MAFIVDYFVPTAGGGIPLVMGNDTAAGQSFTGEDCELDFVKFKLSKDGSPTGTACAKIYAHSGTYGSSSVPTGSVLATSDSLDISTLTTTYTEKTFTFSGSNKINLVDTTKYVVVFSVSFSTGDWDNHVLFGSAYFESPDHDGNLSKYATGWTADSGIDAYFYVYGNLTDEIERGLWTKGQYVSGTWMNPGTAANDSTVGILSWSNVNNIKASDDNYATAVSSGVNGQETNYLKATNFDFDIPADTVIDGIEMRIERKSSSNGTYHWTNDIVSGNGGVHIVKSDGSIGTTNKGVSAKWSTTEETVTYGGSSDLWGESWNYISINDSDFGVVIHPVIRAISGTTTAYVDHIQIRVFFSEGTASVDRSIYTSGGLSASETWNLYAEGGLQGEVNRGIYTRGQGTESVDRGIYTSGMIDAEMERGLYAVGGSAIVRGLYAVGSEPETIDRGIYTEGGEVSEFERGIWTYGGVDGALPLLMWDGVKWIEIGGVEDNGGWLPVKGEYTIGADADGLDYINVEQSVIDILEKGTRIKVTQNSVEDYGIVNDVDDTNNKIGIFLSVSSGTRNRLDSAVISDLYYSREKMPKGFPLDDDSWMLEETANGSQANPVTTTWYEMDRITLPMGLWDVRYSAMGYAYGTDANLYIYVYSTLADTTATQGGGEWTDKNFLRTDNSEIERVGAPFYRIGQLNLSAEDDYFLNGMVTFNNDVDNLQLNNSVIRAVNAYL